MPRFSAYEAEDMLTDNGVKLRIINMLGDNVLTNNEEVLEVEPETMVLELKTLLAARARVCRLDEIQDPDKIELILQRDTSGPTTVQGAHLADMTDMGRAATLEQYGIATLGKTYTIHAVCQTPPPLALAPPPQRHGFYAPDFGLIHRPRDDEHGLRAPRGGRHCRKTRRRRKRRRRKKTKHRRRKKTKHRRRRRRKTRRRRRKR